MREIQLFIWKIQLVNMSSEFIYPFHVLLHKQRHLWTALETTKSCSFPNTASHQLERTSAYLLTGSSNAHNNRGTPSLKFVLTKSDLFVAAAMWNCNKSHQFRKTYLVTTLQSRSHYRDTSNALKTVVNATIRKVNNNLLYWLVMVFWIYKFRDPKILSCKSQTIMSKMNKCLTTNAKSNHDIPFLFIGST